MSGELVALALLVGAGTWALRYLPLRLSWSRGVREEPAPGAENAVVVPGRTTSRSTSRSKRESGAARTLKRFLEAIGVAAVAALAAAALLPYLQELVTLGVGGAGEGAVGEGMRLLSRVVPLSVGVVATVLAFLPQRSVGAGTLVGAAAYGLSLWLLGGA